MPRLAPARVDDRVVVYASAPTRLVAYMIDLVLLSALVFVAAIVLSALLGPTVHFDPSADVLRNTVRVEKGRALVDTVVGAALSALYFTLSWYRWRASPGQWLLGVALAPVPLTRALVRWLIAFGPFASAIVVVSASNLSSFLVWTVATLWDLVLLVSVVRSPSKQGIHDRVAGTVVTMSARPVPAAYT